MTQAPTAPSRDDVRSAIVDAAARLLRAEGVRALTTRAVAHAAGVQAPTIYRLFGDKDGLVDAVAEHVMATYVTTEAAAGAAARVDDPVADLRSGWQAHVDFGLANPELYLLLTTRGGPQHSPATAAGIEVLRGRVRRLATAGLLAVDEERALAMVHAAGTGTVVALLGMPAGHRDPGLADAMLASVLTGILTTAPPTPSTETTTLLTTLTSALPDLPALTDAERSLLGEWTSRVLAGLRPDQGAAPPRGVGARRGGEDPGRGAAGAAAGERADGPPGTGSDDAPRDPEGRRRPAGWSR